MSDCANKVACCPGGPFDINPPAAVPTYWNTEQSASASCPAGADGGPFTATIPANTYFSHVSQKDADNQAKAAATAQANQMLSQCSPPVPGTMDGLLWLMPCNDGADPCHATDPDDQMVVLQGTPGHLYTATLRIRGVIEMFEYSGGSVSPFTSYVYLNPTNASVGVNIYSIEVSDPPAVYCLNNQVDFDPLVHVVDYTFQVPIAAGAIVTLKARCIDGKESRNNANLLANNAPPLPATIQGAGGTTPYNGQFLQVLVLNIKA